MILKVKQMSLSKSIDLHGLRYSEAELDLEDFILANTAPFEVITGNSEGMAKIVQKLLNKYNLSAIHINPNNFGAVMVTERM